MSKSISVDELSKAVEKELTIYGANIVAGLKKEAKKSADELVARTKATAPVGKRKKHYKNSIKNKVLKETERGIAYVWYVDGSDYRLSHLLEDGHATRNGGRVEGTGFIQNARNAVLADYEKAVEGVIKNG